MRILVTGCTSQQTNPESHRRSANFTGLLWEALRSDEGNEVHWLEPSVTWSDSELAGYDHVLVGLSSPLAMGANRAYGAMSVIERLWGDRRLSLVVDQPDPDLIARGLRSVTGNWGSFTKPFFSYRKEYELARDSRTNARLRMTAHRLLTRPWPRTIVPGLPWTDAADAEARLPEGAAGRVTAVNLDNLLLRRFAGDRSAPRPERLREWAYEKHADYKWVQAQNLGYDKRPLPANHRVETDRAAAAQLRESTGFLLPPSRGGAWWSPKVAMSLAQLTPVFTDWRRAEALGPEWARLPSSAEAAWGGELDELASDQYVRYAEAIPGSADAVKAIYKAAGMGPARTRRTA